MVDIPAKMRRTIAVLLRDLRPQELREAVDFICFLKTRAKISPAQAYFWTRQWQAMERRAEHDKQQGRVIGDGTTAGLLRALHA